MYQCKTKKLNDGYVTLISVLIIGAIGLTITLSLLLLGLSASRTSFAYEQQNTAQGLAEACTEEGLQQIRNSTPFTGGGTLNLSTGDCSYSVTSQGGEDRTIEASATVGGVVRKIKVIIDKINPSIQIVTWQNVADF